MNTPAELFKNVLIVSANEGHIRVDRSFFKGVRIFQTRTAASGAESMAYLRKHRADLVMCDAQLADMTGVDFLRGLANEPSLATIPAIMATTRNARQAVLEAVRAGCAGYLARPYSQAAFDKHLGFAMRSALFAQEKERSLRKARADLAAGREDEAVAGFEAVTAAPDEATRHFREGMAHLAEKRFDPAIAAFDRAVTLNALYAEAYLGLASAWQAKGNTDKARKYMRQAAAACARQRNFQELKDRFAAYLQQDKDGFNPFVALGNEEMSRRDYGAAIGAYAHAVELTPRRGDVYVEMSKAYHFLRKPQQALKAVTKGLRLQPDNPAGKTLYKRFTGKSYGDIETMEDFQKSASPMKLPLFVRGALYVAAIATDLASKGRRRLAA
mgnify:FL=1